MEPLERFVAGLSDEQFDYLNRNRVASQQLLDEYDRRQRSAEEGQRASVQTELASIDCAAVRDLCKALNPVRIHPYCDGSYVRCMNTDLDVIFPGKIYRPQVK